MQVWSIFCDAVLVTVICCDAIAFAICLNKFDQICSHCDVNIVDVHDLCVTGHEIFQACHWRHLG